MNDKLTALLTGERAPGVYRFASPAKATTVQAAAERLGWRFFHLDGRQIASKAEFLAACAAAMQFPGYFGNNWDALEDCLRDLAWAPAQRGRLVLYDHARCFAGAGRDFTVALEIFRSAVRSWGDTATPMAVLLRDAGRGMDGVARL